MASHTVALVPGDGIGPETSAAMQRWWRPAAPISFGMWPRRGRISWREHGTPLPASTIEAGQAEQRLPSRVPSPRRWARDSAA